MFRKLLPYLVYFIYRSFSMTWRLSIYEPEEMKNMLEKREPFMMAHWHGDELALYQLIGKYRVATMVSTSKDGNMMAKLIELIGGKSSRGSSTRSAVTGLRGLLRLIKNGANASMAVDGPKGPYHEVKPGVFEISKLVNLPIFVGGVSCSSAFVAKKAWNKAYLPCPFARVQIYWHGPFPAIREEEDCHDPVLKEELSKALDIAGQQAAKLIATS